MGAFAFSLVMFLAHTQETRRLQVLVTRLHLHLRCAQLLGKYGVPVSLNFLLRSSLSLPSQVIQLPLNGSNGFNGISDPPEHGEDGLLDPTGVRFYSQVFLPIPQFPSPPKSSPSLPASSPASTSDRKQHLPVIIPSSINAKSRSAKSFLDLRAITPDCPAVSAEHQEFLIRRVLAVAGRSTAIDWRGLHSDLLFVQVSQILLLRTMCSGTPMMKSRIDIRSTIASVLLASQLFMFPLSDFVSQHHSP